MDLYIQRISFDRDALPADEALRYPFHIPAIRQFIEEESFSFQAPVTIFTGENGSGKSTLIEAIACCFGLNPEGGSKNFNFSTCRTHSRLSEYMYYSRLRQPRDSFFLRAESFYNVATAIGHLGVERNYGVADLHGCSHGESFFAVLMNRLRGNGLYVMDEPEAAISVTRQLEMLQILKQLEAGDSQFIIATHSPILMAYPGADIVRLDEHGFSRVDYEYTEQYLVMRRFMQNYKQVLRDCGL